MAQYKVTRNEDSQVTYEGDSFQGALNGIITVAGAPLDTFTFEFFGDSQGAMPYDLQCGEANGNKWFTEYVDDEPDYIPFDTKTQMKQHIAYIDYLAHGIR